MSDRSLGASARWRFFLMLVWVISGAAVLIGLLVVYGAILPSAFTRILELAGRHSVRFEDPASATYTLKELVFAACFLFSIATAFVAWAWLPHRAPGSDSTSVSRRSIVVAIVAVGIFAAIMHFGMRHFAPYDQSGMLDLGWRLSLGQQPYGQFFNAFPPGHYLPVKLAFEVIGASWRAVILLTAISSVGAFLWMFWLLRRIVSGFHTAVLLALATVATTGILYSFWWYNPMTTLAGCIFLLSAIFLSEASDDSKSRFSYFSALVILSMMKPNLAAVLIITVTFILAVSAARKVMLVLSVAAFATVNVILLLNDATLLDVIRSYLSVDRIGNFFIHDFALFGFGVSMPNVVGDSLIILIPVAAAGIALAASSKSGRKISSLTLALCCAGIFSGFVGLATNMELFISEGTLMSLSACVLLLRVNATGTTKNARTWEHRLVFSSCACLIVYGTTLGAARLRPWIVGPLFMFHEVTPAKEGNPYPFFRGLTTGENFSRTMAALQAVVTRYPNNRIFFEDIYSFAGAVFNRVPLTIDVSAREFATPRLFPQNFPLKALVKGDPVDVLVCPFPCEEARRKLAFIPNDSLTVRSTGRAPFLTEVYVYTRPGLGKETQLPKTTNAR